MMSLKWRHGTCIDMKTQKKTITGRTLTHNLFKFLAKTSMTYCCFVLKGCLSCHRLLVETSRNHANQSNMSAFNSG